MNEQERRERLLAEEVRNYEEVRKERPKVRVILTDHRWQGGFSLLKKLVCECGSDLFLLVFENERMDLILVQCAKCAALYNLDYNHHRTTGAQIRPVNPISPS